MSQTRVLKDKILTTYHSPFEIEANLYTYCKKRSSLFKMVSSEIDQQYMEQEWNMYHYLITNVLSIS